MGHGSGTAHDPADVWVEEQAFSALAPWLRHKRMEVAKLYNSAATPDSYRDFAMELFRQLDRSRKGAVSVRDLLNWASERCNSSGHVVPTDYLVRQFRRADIDLLGELDFEGVLLLQYLGSLRLTFCSSCRAFIDASVEDHFSCASCFGKAGARGGAQLDLCVRCFDAGQGWAHTREAGAAGHVFSRVSELRPPASVTCCCCGQAHAMVPGYMQGYLGDTHVRTVGDDARKWVCEVCALRPVGGDGLTFRWESEPAHFQEGGLFTDAALASAGGAGEPVAQAAWKKMADARIAPRCPTCESAAGTQARGGGGDGNDDAPPGSYACNVRSLAAAASAATRRVTAVMAGAGAAPLDSAHARHRAAVCVCCHEVHDVTHRVMGDTLPGYLYGPSFTEHMKLLANGQYLCEWCAKYMCGRCGTAYVDIANPTMAKWSKFVDCRHGCKAAEWGGWLSVRSKLRQLAASPMRPHCSTCAVKIGQGTLLDLSARVDEKGEGRVARVVQCHCCKESHDAAEVSGVVEGEVPAYLPMPDYETHLKELPDGRFLCEWCSKWMCHRCGKPKWTDTRPEVGLWSERSYFCRGGCDPVGAGPMTWDMTLVAAQAHVVQRPHCRMCRERVVTGRLVERPYKTPQQQQ